ARFMFMNLDRVGLRFTARESQNQVTQLEDRWIHSRFNRVTGAVNDSLRAYRFDEAARAVYDFFWGEFCDWYLEIIKPRLSGEEKAAQESASLLAALFESALRLLSPFMPFITEEIWHAM